MNMSYCRFHNTEIDLRDCVDALDNSERLSDNERFAAERMYDLCQQYIESYEYWRDCNNEEEEETV